MTNNDLHLVNFLRLRFSKTNVYFVENTLRRSMSETRLSSFALKALTGKTRQPILFSL
jgi:hypothetical protein